LLIAPETSGNSLGRALSLAEMLRHVGPLSVAAFDDGPLWEGARDSGFEITPFSDRRQLKRLVQAHREAGDTLTVIAIKPFLTSLG